MALEDFSCRKGEVMQVSGNYSAIGSISEVHPAQRMRRTSARSGGGSGTDTVSISEEALAAYRNAFPQGDAPLDEEASDTGAKFRKALEEAWNGSEETSLGGRFLSAISSWKRQPEDVSTLQEKVRA